MGGRVKPGHDERGRDRAMTILGLNVYKTRCIP